jgi:hypothetical protein
MPQRCAVVLAAAVLFVVPSAQDQDASIQPGDVCTHQGLFVDPCFTVHGRMGAANGTPSYRIWVMSSGRVLGVPQLCVLPPSLDSLIGVEDKLVYADFVVRPLAKETAGWMRMVCVASVSKIVTRPAYFIRPSRD